MQKMRNQSPATFLLMAFLLFRALSQWTTPNAPTGSSVYAVQFLKLSQEQVQQLPSGSIIITEMEFLENQVRNTAAVLAVGLHYVNFTSQLPFVNFSKKQQINNITTPTRQSQQASNSTLSQTQNPGQPGSGKYSGIAKNINRLGVKGVLIPLLGAQPAGAAFPRLAATISPTPPESHSLNSPSIPTTDTNSTTSRTNQDSNVTDAGNKTGGNSSGMMNTTMDGQFQGVWLFSPIPIDFMLNQIYKISGRIDPSAILSANIQNQSQLSVRVIFSGLQPSSQIRCIQTIKREQQSFSNFSISCKMKLAGVFYVSIFVGESGFTTDTVRQVHQQPNQTLNMSSPIVPSALSLQVVQSRLSVRWESTAPLTKIKFDQNNLAVEYVVSNFHYVFRVPHCDFIDFEQVQTTITISHANSRDGTLYGISSLFGIPTNLKFRPVQHFNPTSRDNIFNVALTLPQRMSVDQTTELIANFSVNVLNQIVVISPYQQLTKLYFSDQLRMVSTTPGKGIIPALRNCTLSIQIAHEGAYLVQINEETGLEVLSLPMYVGAVYPLMPDYLDLKMQAQTDQLSPLSGYEQYMNMLYSRQEVSQPPRQSSESDVIQFMLKLLNLLRRKLIIYPLLLDSKLTEIASKHSEEMAANSYVGHRNLEGNGPRERARDAGLNCLVAENVARVSSLVEAHLFWLRSGIDLDNTLSRIWTKVGIGLKQNDLGQYLVTVLFAARDITKQPLSLIEIQVHRTQIVEVLSRKFRSIRSENKQASSLIGRWMSSDRSIPIVQYLVQQGIKQLMMYSVYRFNYYPGFVADLEKSINLTPLDIFQQLGFNLGVSALDSTMMECYVVFIAVRNT